jgi:ABC-type lipoprotein export system ATPase subunit
MTLLRFEGVTRRHRVGRDVVSLLEDVSFEVWPGDVVAVLGPRGEGKTTLLRIAAGIEAPDSGRVLLDGADIRGLPAAERTRRLRTVGYAPKAWRVAHGKPVLDHVALPLLAEGRPLVSALAKAHELLERVGAVGYAEATADELGPAELTRAALAQALAREPRLLLVDEPGVLAEPSEREELLRLLCSLAAERPATALVLTARDVAGVAGAPRVLTLGDGVLRGAAEAPRAQVVPFRRRPGAQAAPAR